MRSARLVRERDTNNAVYALAYAPDGERLAIGGGFYYGAGFISFEDARGQWDFVGHDLHNPTVSAMAFDATGRYLAVARWAFAHRWASSLLYDLSAARPPEEGRAFQNLQRAASEAPTELAEDDAWREQLGLGGRGYGTGVAIRDGELFVRRSMNRAADSISRFSTADVRATPCPGLTSARMIDVGATVVTGHGAEVIGRTDGPAVSLATAPGDARITSITAADRSGAFTTCHEDGTIAHWVATSADGGAVTVSLDRVRSGHDAPISAACHLAIDDLLVTADRAGQVHLWRDDRVIAAWRTPEDVSIRALAAHPGMPRVVAGGKRGGPSPGYFGMWDVLV